MSTARAGASATSAVRGAGAAARHLWARGTILLLALVLGVAPVQAQRSPPERGGQDRAEMERRFRAEVQRRVQERLQLTDEASERLTQVSGPFDDRRRELAREEFGVRRRVEALLGEEEADQTEARELLSRLVDLRARESELFAEEQEALLEILTPTQVLELQEFRRELGQRIRALRGRNDDGGRRRGPGGSGGPGWSGGDLSAGPGNVDGVRGVGLSVKARSR